MKLASSEEYISRRSPVLSARGMVASSQVPASLAGIEILKEGGNAADAAVAVAAVLNVTQPCSTGLGGDCFCLYFSASEKKVLALNGSGRAPQALSLGRVRKEGFHKSLPPHHPFTITVPGAPAAWEEVAEKLGRLKLNNILEPAITLAEEGFPVAPLSSVWWREGAERLLRRQPFGKELMSGDRGPLAGEMMRIPSLANSLKTLAEEGSKAFYQGLIAERIVAAVRDAGGVLTMDDLASHSSEWVDPINIDYRGVKVWECPPNGSGLAALLALNLLKQFDLKDFPAGSSERYHLLIECMRLAFADAGFYIADPDFAPVPVDPLLSSDYSRERSRLIDLSRAGTRLFPGKIKGFAGRDTVYFCVADGEGNACSFINSNFLGFGTGIVPEGCGFALQNRGYGFNLDPKHPNCLAPGKRPYHTIIPGLSTHSSTGSFHSAFGVMGGMMQPQGHLQVISALVDDELDPQAALDRGRFQIENGLPTGPVLLEDSVVPVLRDELILKGHQIKVISGIDRPCFGLGQIILLDSKGVLWGGSDPRGDGCALGLP